jgi:hypothetical protein
MHQGHGRAESTFFYTLDLASGFWQMLLHSNSVPKTAFTLPGLGQYEWLMSPMGLLGCPASFQRLMEKLMDNISVHIDDLLIHSQNHEQHLASLDHVMQRIEDNHMKINPSKCFFGNTEVSYLVFRLTPSGIKPCKDTVKAVEMVKIPQTIGEIKSFLGLCNFFRTYIKDFARIGVPLNIATRKDAENTKSPISGKALEAFHHLKHMSML